MKRVLYIAFLSAMVVACGGKEDTANPVSPKPKPEPPEPPAVELPELPGPPSGAEMRVVGYLPDWSYGAVLNTLDWSALTHLNLAFVNPDAEGNMVDGFPDADLATIVGKARENGVKVLPSMGGGGGGGNIASLISTEAGMIGFCDKILSYVEANGMDGVDLDLEFGMGSPVWVNYSAFVARLRLLCDERGLLLTTAVSTWFSGDITTPTLQAFDIVNIMCYDNDTNGFEHHSSYEFAEEMAAYFVSRGVKPGHVVIGIPFYGRLKNGSWNDALSYADILSRYPNAAKSDFSGGYSYNGSQTIAWKCRLATVYGGVMIWELGQDAIGSGSLLKVVKDNI